MSLVDGRVHQDNDVVYDANQDCQPDVFRVVHLHSTAGSFLAPDPRPAFGFPGPGGTYLVCCCAQGG